MRGALYLSGPSNGAMPDVITLALPTGQKLELTLAQAMAISRILQDMVVFAGQRKGRGAAITPEAHVTRYGA